MKLKSSFVDRRRFLNWLGSGCIAAFLGSLLQPVFRFVVPPRRPPTRVVLPFADYKDMPADSARRFPWGSQPGILRRDGGGEFKAFVGVCTHLDCNVAYLPEKRKFFCACHEGWYDEEGNNQAGPPPRPLERLDVAVEGESLVVKKRTPT